MSGSITGGFSPKDPDDVDLFVFDVTAALNGDEMVEGSATMLSALAPATVVFGQPLVVADVATTVTEATAATPATPAVPAKPATPTSPAVAGVPAVPATPAVAASVVVSGYVSGGTLGALYLLSVEFTTSDGRTLRRGRQVLVTHC